MTQIINFAAARAAHIAIYRATAPQLARKPPTGRRSLTAVQRKHRDEVRARARASL